MVASGSKARNQQLGAKYSTLGDARVLWSLKLQIEMADTFQLEIVTPEKMVVRDSAEEVQIPGKNGYLGVLPGHAPLITELSSGELSYRTGSQTHRFAVAWGFAEVLPDKVTILAETAERAEEIDVQRAQREKERAEEHLASGATEEDFTKAEAELKRAETRLEVAQHKP
jgi:F-type H+-transporting ATPase subunit epsilon